MPLKLTNPLGRLADSAREKPFGLAGTWLLIAMLGVLLVLPIGMTVGKAFWYESGEGDGHLSLFWFRRVLGDGQTWVFLKNGISLAGLTTLFCLVLSVPLAVLRARTTFRGQNLLGMVILLPMILPPFVGAMSLKRFLGKFGVFNEILVDLGVYTWAEVPTWGEGSIVSVAIIQSLALFPILYLNASAALANIDPAYLEASRNLGAGGLRTFFTVTLPLMRPGLFAGGTIVFIWSFTDIGTPLILNVRDLLPVRIFDELTSAAYTPRVFAMVFVLLVIAVLLYVLGKFVFGRAGDVGGSKSTSHANARKLGLGGTIGAWLLFGGVLALAVLPHLGVTLLAVSDRWLNSVLPQSYTAAHLTGVMESPDTYRSILNSLQYAGFSTVLDLLLGFLAGWLIIRSKAFGAGLLDALVMLPLAVPGLILAAGYVALTAPGTIFEAIGPTHNPFTILVVAYTVRRIPFVVRGVSAGLQQVPESMEESARNLGCSHAGAARRITLPLIAANLVAAGVLAFAFAMLEVSDSLILAQVADYYPITKKIFTEFTAGTRDSINTAAALGVYGMALLGGTMALASLLLGKKLGAIFRA